MFYIYLNFNKMICLQIPVLDAQMPFLHNCFENVFVLSTHSLFSINESLS